MHRIERLRDMLVVERFLAAQRERARRADRVLDLSPVDRPLRESEQLLVGHRFRGVHLLQERAPDLHASVGRELLEVQGDVDAREEGLVEGLDAVGG